MSASVTHSVTKDGHLLNVSYWNNVKVHDDASTVARLVPDNVFERATSRVWVTWI